MSTWSINGKELPYLDVDGLVFTLQNQDDDYAEIRLPKNYDASLDAMFNYGASVVIKYGTATAFSGLVDGPVIDATGIGEFKRIFVYGPWRRFSQQMFLYLYPYYSKDYNTTHGILGGSANSLLFTILQQCAAYITVGTIDVGSVTIPTSDIYDMTISQVIKSILRYIPDSLVLFDYSTSKPTCHIVRSGNAKVVTRTLNPSVDKCMDLSLRPRYDLMLDAVRIDWEATKRIKYGLCERWQEGYGMANTNTAAAPVTQWEGFTLHGTSVTGDFSKSRQFRRTLRLSGALEETTYVLRGNIFNAEMSGIVNGTAPGVSGPNVKLYVWQSFFRVFCAPSSLNIRAKTDSRLYIDNPSYKGSVTCTMSPNTLRPFYQLGFIHSSFVTGDTTSAPLCCVYPFDSIPKVFTEQLSLQSSVASLQWTDIYQTQNPAGFHTFTTPHVLFVAPSQFNGEYFSKTVSDNSLESIPSSIATSILAANSTLFHDGSVKLFSQEAPLLFFGTSRRVTISGVNVTTPVQRVVYDVSTDTYNLELGAPSHLGTQDLIALLRAGT